jgi:teichuronic acid biosynthesis glycosyltransferase TuaG
MNSIIVSVVMPAFNSEKYISRSIESVLSQTYNNFELIIIDDKSTDKTSSLIKNYAAKDSRIIFIQNDVNSGPAYSRSMGVQKSKGHYVAFIDSDDLWASDKLIKQLDFMRNENCNFSYTLQSFILEDEAFSNCTFPVLKKYSFLSALVYRGIGTASVMLERELLTPDVILRNENRLSEDLVWWLLILKKGYEAKLCEFNLNGYRKTPGQRSSRFFDNQKSIFAIYNQELGFSILISIILHIIYVFTSLYRKIRLALCEQVTLLIQRFGFNK